MAEARSRVGGRLVKRDGSARGSAGANLWPMGFHHLAFASRDLPATHRFYTEAMGFRLVKLVAAPTPEGGWAKHVFYDTGDGTMIAFWELHVDAFGDSFPTDLNSPIGLPGWVNHVAFAASSGEDLDARRTRWQEHGITVLEIDHEWCRSIYATDPNGITVEFCITTRAFAAEETAWAGDNVLSDAPELETTVPKSIVHRPLARA
jgi:catechol 2,3-dioxygenase-like lactoylglutathione lyase family enzyme